MDLKYALKVAVGGAFLAAFFKDSDITNVMFPAVGLLTTIQPELGSTVQKGWGRLAGSAIGDAIGGLVLSSFDWHLNEFFIVN